MALPSMTGRRSTLEGSLIPDSLISDSLILAFANDGSEHPPGAKLAAFEVGPAVGGSTARTPEQREFDEIFAAVYKELKRLASFFRRAERHATMSTTDIVDETYIKLLSSSSPVASRDRLHFKRIAARAMRQILTDAARRRGADKRGGLFQFISLTPAHAGTPAPNIRLLDLHRSLDDLAQARPRTAEMVELRYFGGFSIEEIRQIFGVSDATVERDLRGALAWLRLALEGELGTE